MSESHSCTQVHIKRDLEHCEVHVEAEIPAEIIFGYRAETLKSLKRSIEVPGFRKGNVPDELIIKHVGEERLARETAEHAIGEELPKLFAAEKLLVIEAPKVTIRGAESNTLRF